MTPGPTTPSAAVVEAVRAALATAGDPDRASAQQRYMKSDLPFRGLTSPELKALLRPLLADAAYRIGARQEWEAAVRELWDHATHREERYAALALARHRCYRAWRDPSALPLYEHLVTTGAWWDLVDPIAADLVGGLLLEHPDVLGPLMRTWAASEDVWLRRSAILSQLGAKDRTDTALLRACIEPNLEDRSFWVRKAIGWALRQYARTDPDWVRAEVLRYGERLSGLSRREALKHL
jgi:3-methyladenine DNA glycosylase AlkD